MFRHSAVYIRSDRGIDGPADLRGKRIGVPEYQMSAALWVRGFLADEFAVAAKDINWVQGGLETPGRRDKFPLNLPAGFPLASAPSGKTLSAMLADGRARRGHLGAAAICFVAGHPMVRRLSDYRAAERDYYRRSGCFPIMHAVGIRPDLLEAAWPGRQRLQGVRRGQADRGCGSGGDHRAQDRAAMGDRRARRDARRWATISGPTACRQTASAWS